MIISTKLKLSLMMLVAFASTKFLQGIMVDGGVMGATTLISNHNLRLSETAGITQKCCKDANIKEDLRKEMDT